MVRKILFGLEVALVGAVQLLALGAIVLSWWPASAQTAAANAPATAPALGSFLTHYPAGKHEKAALDRSWLALGPDAFVGYRIIKVKTRAHGVAAPSPAKSFETECYGLGGQIARLDNPFDVGRTYAQVRGLSLDTHIPPVLCVAAEHQPLGALLQNSFKHPYYDDRYLGVFVLTPKAAAAMMVSYHRAKARELRTQADIAEKAIADQKRIADWREKLAIGTETHCGPVLSLRGPMVEVAYGTRAGWVRRAELFPPAEAGRCWEFSGL